MRFVVLALVIVGCTGKSMKCGDKALLLWPKAQSIEYSLQEVSFATLSSLYHLSGSAAEIYYESGVDGHGFQGEIAEPHLMGARGGLCVPEDVASSLALSAYAQFERLYQFEQRLGTADQLTWPRKVGVEIHLNGRDSDTHNNAHYFGAQDIITLVPYTRGDVPVAMNLGIVAHEHFHAHFQAQVLKRINSALPTILSSNGTRVSADDLYDVDLSAPAGLNNFVLRGWNEGLADFFAAVYTGTPNFFDASIPGSASERDLRRPLMAMDTAATLQQVADENRSRYGQMAAIDELTKTAYGQGSLLARLMYAIATSGSQGSPEQFLARVMAHLPQVADRVLAQYSANILDFETIVPVLVKNARLNADACAILRAVVRPNQMAEISQCSN